MPATAVLAGLLLIVSFSMSHSVVEVEGTDWVEPVLLWISVCMPTGMGKSSLCKFLRKIVFEAQKQCREHEDDPTTSWLMDDQSFEKMGDIMHKNHWKLLGLYDELPMFLSQVNIFRGRGLSDSHELAVFLQLYGADPWVRRTGEIYALTTPYFILTHKCLLHSIIICTDIVWFHNSTYSRCVTLIYTMVFVAILSHGSHLHLYYSFWGSELRNGPHWPDCRRLHTA